MQDQATQPRRGVVVASGYGLKVYVERGHLIVHDGIGDDRRTRRFARVHSGLERLVVLGQSGYVTFDALTWLRDIGAAFVQVDSDARLVSSTASVGTDQPALRRAQALAADAAVGTEVARMLLRDKVRGQGTVCAELSEDGDTEAFDAASAEIEKAATLEQLLGVESSAALTYWGAWRHVPVPFGGRDRARAPAHWLTFGHRHSPLTGSPRLAANPANAILNYLYSLLEAEATLACHTMGLDPGLGIFHRDRRSRASLAADLMEACRPTVDAYLLALLQQRRLNKRDFVETRRGVCRVLPPLARELGRTAPTWRAHIAPIAEQVAEMLSVAAGGTVPPTPLTGEARRRGWDIRSSRKKQAHAVAGPLPATCRGCGGDLPDRRRRMCEGCRREQALEAVSTARPVANAVLAQLRKDGRDPAHGGEAGRRRGSKNAAHHRARREWSAAADGQRDLPHFRSEILPLLSASTPRELAAATGLSHHYCSLIRLGKRVPHPRHWEALRAATEPRS